jgi:hypothetical protein
MAFLKRIFGGSSGSETSDPPPVAAEPDEPLDADAAERAYELELARAEQDRLDDLTRRQLRYADYAWEPPRQGGERRADDGDDGESGG